MATWHMVLDHGFVSPRRLHMNERANLNRQVRKKSAIEAPAACMQVIQDGKKVYFTTLIMHTLKLLLVGYYQSWRSIINHSDQTSKILWSWLGILASLANLRLQQADQTFSHNSRIGLVSQTLNPKLYNYWPLEHGILILLGRNYPTRCILTLADLSTLRPGSIAREESLSLQVL